MSVVEGLNEGPWRAARERWPIGSPVGNAFLPPATRNWLAGRARRDWPSAPDQKSSRAGLWLLMLMVLLAAHPVRVPLGSETVSVFDLALVPLGLVFVVRRLAGRRMEWGPRIVLVALIVQFAVTLLSMTWTVSSGETLVATIVAAEALVVYLLVLDFGTGRPAGQLAGLLGVYSLLLVASSTATFVGLPGFEPPATAEDPWGWTARLSHSLIGKSNNLATLLVLIAPVVWYAGRLLDRMWLKVTALITVAAIALTLSRGAMLALVVMAGVWFLTKPGSRWARARQRSQRVGTVVVTVLAVVGGSVLVLLGLTAVQGRGVSLDGRLSLDDNGRFALYRQALERASERLLGFGPGASEVDVHNTYLQALVDSGVIFGTLFVVSLAMLVVPWFARAYRSVSEGTRRITGLAFVGLLVICMVESSYEGTLLRQLMWLVLALIVAWHGASARQREGDTGWDAPAPGWSPPDGRGWLGRDA